MRARGGRFGRGFALNVVAVTLAVGVSGWNITPARVAANADAPRTPLIVNGTLANISQFPYLAGILRRNVADPFTAQFCGGSVVAPDLVLTAAHCVDDRTASSLDVLTDATTLAVGEGVRTQVESIAVHPSWDDQTNQNDLAVLRLVEPVTAPPILVVPPGYEATWAPKVGAATAGWGCTDVSAGGVCLPGGFPDALHAGAVELRSDRDCASILGGEFFDKATMRCAGLSATNGSAVDSCEGDSGGPLRISRPGLPPMLVGVVSWGFVCGRYPGVYTKLEKYRPWLRSNGVPIPASAFVGAPTKNVIDTFDRPFTCDVNGDGFDDEFMYRTGAGPDQLRYGDSTGSLSQVAAVNVGGAFTPLAADFDGDDDCDVLWYRPGDATEALWRGSADGFSIVSAPTVTRSYVPAVGDFDGDDRADIFWYDPTGVRSVMWFGRASRFTAGGEVLAPLNAVPHAGDFDGDGAADVVFDLVEPTPDVVWLGASDGFTPLVDPVNVPGDGPLLVGDFDGDGFADALRDLAAGPDELWRGGPDARFVRRVRPQQYSVGAVGLVGDFDGDDRADLHWYRPGSPLDVLWLGR